MAKTKIGKAIVQYMKDFIDELDGAGLIVTDEIKLKEYGEFKNLQAIVLKDKPVLDKQKINALRKVLNYNLDGEAKHFEEYLSDEYGSNLAAEFEALKSDEERLKYMEENGYTNHIYYNILLLSPLV